MPEELGSGNRPSTVGKNFKTLGRPTSYWPESGR
jgi:hypothetical protein